MNLIKARLSRHTYNRWFVFFTLLFGSCVTITDALAHHGTWLHKHEIVVQNQAKKYNLPGYVMIYVEKGQPAKFMLFGKTSKRGRHINPDTVFRLASVSKTFTSVLVGKLVEKNRLSWQTPISALAPEFGFQKSDKGGITLTHLLGQSSGYMRNAYDNLIEANYSQDRVLTMLAKLDLMCKPGKCYSYQNTLFATLEHHFQQKNTSYAAQLSQEVFKPLKMSRASVGKKALQQGNNWAKPHVAISRKTWRQTKVSNDYYRYPAAAGVNASAKDIEIWLRAMLGEYPKTITPALVEQLTEPKIRTKRDLNRRSWRRHLKDAHYGLGWRVYDFGGEQINYHGGWVQGYRADVSFAPEQGVAYAMLMNAESNLINGFTADFWQRYFKQVKKRAQTASTK